MLYEVITDRQVRFPHHPQPHQEDVHVEFPGTPSRTGPASFRPLHLLAKHEQFLRGKDGLPEHRQVEIPGLVSVITSYSIHYTKLYDSAIWKIRFRPRISPRSSPNPSEHTAKHAVTIFIVEIQLRFFFKNISLHFYNIRCTSTVTLILSRGQT